MSDQFFGDPEGANNDTFDTIEITGPACASCFAIIGRILGFTRVLGLRVGAYELCKLGDLVGRVLLNLAKRPRGPDELSCNVRLGCHPQFM